MFRKAAAALAVGVTIVALAGCASGDSGGGSDASAEGGLITIIVNDPANPYWAAEGDAAAAEAEKLGYTSKIGAHNGDSKKESDLVDTAITNKSVAVVLDPADANGSIGAVKKLVAADIPVFLVNAEINEEGLAQSQLVSNNAQGAALGAQEWVNRVGTTGEYVELLGRQADNNAATRSNGYASILSQYPDLKLVGSEVANWDQKEGHDKMQSLLAANPNIIGVIAGNDQMALGAIAALKEAGKLDQVKVGGFDGAPDAAKAITDGTLQYTVLQPVVVYATAAVQQADSFLRTGKTGVSEEKQSFDCVLITPENVASYGNFSVDG
ncbi:MAG: D-ribose transporter substrate-binding protein [Microbacteriaceae bacterium]|jgi:erythritol transport system substrate-binding protein|nr:D-ribose transporter substrate-binding protein [Microbacteriaceae bacterium]